MKHGHTDSFHFHLGETFKFIRYILARWYDSFACMQTQTVFYQRNMTRVCFFSMELQISSYSMPWNANSTTASFPKGGGHRNTYTCILISLVCVCVFPKQACACARFRVVCMQTFSCNPYVLCLYLPVWGSISKGSVPPIALCSAISNEMQWRSRFVWGQ